MFSVRRLSILSIPQRAESGRQQFRITGDLELVSASPAVVQDDGSQSPQRRSCTSLKLVLLVFVFALCGGFHTALSLFQSVCHRPEVCSGVLAAGTPDQAGSLASRHAGGTSNATSGKNAGTIEEVLADKGQQHQQLLRAAFWLLLVNSMLNPFLYAISSQRFRYFAARLFSRQHPNSGGGDPHGGHLFDISEGLLNNWYYWATHSQLAPVVKVAKTIKKHWEGILSWKKSQINNGILEGLNSILQAAKRKARGYKIQHFKTIAYLLTGKLDFSKINANCLPT